MNRELKETRSSKVLISLLIDNCDQLGIVWNDRILPSPRSQFDTNHLERVHGIENEIHDYAVQQNTLDVCVRLSLDFVFV